MALVILSGATRSGKSVIAKKLIEIGYTKVLTTTTRQRKAHEVNGTTYNFVSKEVFNEAKAKNLYLETDTFSGEQFGLTFAELLGALESNANAVVVLSMEGAKKLRKYLIANKMPHLMCFIVGHAPAIIRQLTMEHGNDSLSEDEFLNKMVNYVQSEKDWVNIAKKENHFDIFFEMLGNDDKEVELISNAINSHIERLNNLPSSIFGQSNKKRT